MGNPFQPVGLPVCRRCDGDGLAHGSDRHFEWTGPGTFHGPCPVCHGRKVDTFWLTRTVLSLAKAAYEELRENVLDPDRLTVLADALEDAGCDGQEILNHLRGKEECPRCEVDVGNLEGEGTIRVSGVRVELGGKGERAFMSRCKHCRGTGWRPLRGPHVRGCWAIDLLH